MIENVPSKCVRVQFPTTCCRKRTPDTFQSHILIMRAYSSFRSRHLSTHVKTKLGPLSDVSAPAGRAGRRRGPGCGERCHCQAAQGRRRSCSRMRIGGSQSQRCGMLPDLDVAAVLAWPCAREPRCLCCEGCCGPAIVPAAEAHAAHLLRAVVRSGTLDALGALELLRAARLCVSRCAGFEGGIDGRSFELPSSLPASSSWWRSFSEPLDASNSASCAGRGATARPGPPRREGGGAE